MPPIGQADTKNAQLVRGALVESRQHGVDVKPAELAWRLWPILEHAREVALPLAHTFDFHRNRLNRLLEAFEPLAAATELSRPRPQLGHPLTVLEKSEDDAH